MSRCSETSRHSGRMDHGDSHFNVSNTTPTHVSKTAPSIISSRCSQIKSELDAVNAELASLRGEHQSEAESVVSGVSDASSLRPQDSVSSVSSRRSSAASRSYGSGPSVSSRHSHRSSRCTSRSGRASAVSTPSLLSQISERPSQQGFEPSAHRSYSSRPRSQYQPTLLGTSTTSSISSQPSRYVVPASSVSSSQYSGSMCELPESSSYYQPSIIRREDGSYYDAKLKVSFKVEERSPDMYACVNNGLRLDEHGDYDLEEDRAPHRGYH